MLWVEQEIRKLGATEIMAGKRERRTGGDRKHNLVLDVRFRDIGPASEKDHRCRGEWGDIGPKW